MKKILYLFIGTVMSVGVVAMLFVLSDAITHKRNGFIRYFSSKAIEKGKTNLGFNSYYFAGYEDHKIYLGNYTAPLLVNTLDTLLLHKKAFRILLDKGVMPYHSAQVRIQKEDFYLIDGTIPILYRGKVSDWTGSQMWKGTKAFSHGVVLDSTDIVFVSSDIKNGESLLAGLHLGEGIKEIPAPGLLEKQIDGLFDSDGMLHYDRESGKVVFLYRYRNQFIVTDNKLRLIYRGKTIDTVSKAQIRIGHVSRSGETKMAAPPLTVNRNSAFYRNLLFIQSGLIGRFEDKKMWDHASIIDVYDLDKNTYISSFYIYDIKKDKMRSFFVRDNHLFAFIGQHLVKYRLSSRITDYYRPAIK